MFYSPGLRHVIVVACYSILTYLVTRNVTVLDRKLWTHRHVYVYVYIVTDFDTLMCFLVNTEE